MAKHTYEAKLPNGETVTRTTARTYTHVIVAKHADWFFEYRKNSFGGLYKDSVNNFFAVTWCGRPDLADKAYNAAVSSHCISKDSDNGKPMHKEVMKLPVSLRGA